MRTRQDTFHSLADLALTSERLGPLPLVNHFIARLRLDALFQRFVPTDDPRVKLPAAAGLSVLLRTIIVEREPLYRQCEFVSSFAPDAFSLPSALADAVQDDAIGRALDQLYDADRACLLTEVVVSATRTFKLILVELHNDSTSVSFCGQYTEATGRTIRGKRAALITYGHSKAHRPDLKQLLFIMTTCHDGGVPVQFRCEAGNASDSRSHEETWESLCQATGRSDFLYVADSKLCNQDALAYLDGHGGRLVCVLPRTRHEDKEFRRWIQTHSPTWELVIDRPHPRRLHGPRDRWWVYQHTLPSVEGWPVIWVRSSHLARHQERARRDRIDAAIAKLEEINRTLAGRRPRRRTPAELQERVDKVLRHYKVQRYLKVTIASDGIERYRQKGPGRPGKNTRYVRTVKVFLRLLWSTDADAIAYDHKSDGMYPLLTNDRKLKPAEVLRAHKRQPTIEKRFSQTKSVLAIAPVLLKNEGRIEALFFVYFLALMVEALIERELRQAMAREGITNLPLYPERRKCRHPSAEQILGLFSGVERHSLVHDGKQVRVFEPELTPLQKQVLQLLGVPDHVYQTPPLSFQ